MPASSTSRLISVQACVGLCIWNYGWIKQIAHIRNIKLSLIEATNCPKQNPALQQHLPRDTNLVVFVNCSLPKVLIGVLHQFLTLTKVHSPGWMQPKQSYSSYIAKRSRRRRNNQFYLAPEPTAPHILHKKNYTARPRLQPQQERRRHHRAVVFCWAIDC